MCPYFIFYIVIGFNFIKKLNSIHNPKKAILCKVLQLFFLKKFGSRMSKININKNKVANK